MKKIVILLGALVAILGCSTDDAPNFFFDFVAVDSVLEVPAFFTVNQSDTLQVAYIRPTSCHGFDGFNVVRNGNEREITVVNKVVEIENNCIDLENDIRIAPLVFNPIEAGEITLRFFNGNDVDGNPNFLTFNVPIIE